MAFSKNRRLADLITANAEQFITSAHVTDAAIVPGDLHATLDLTSKTITVANASTGDNDTTAANTAFVQQEIAALVDSSPGTLNTLNELAAALGDDASFSTTVTNSIATKAPLASPDFTGQLQVTNSATTVQELIVTGNNTRSALSMQSKDSSGNAVDLRMHSLGDGPRGEIFTFTNHDLAFSTNNAAPQMTLQTSGNFGIGISSNIDSKLHVADGTAQINIEGTSGDATLKLESTGNSYWNIFNDQSDARKLKFEDNGNGVALTVERTGNVGIGTTSPASGLHLTGGSNTAAKLTLTNTAPSPDNTWSLHPIYNGQDLLLSEDSDTRVTFKSGGDLFVGGTTDRGRKFVVEGTGDLMALYSTNTGAGGAQLDLIHDSTSYADGDSVGIVNFSTDDRQLGSIKTVATNSDRGRFHIGVRKDSSTYNHNAFQLENNGVETYLDIYSVSGSSRGAGYFRFKTDGSSTEESVAQIYMEQGSGDGGSRKSNMYFQVSDNGSPTTALTIENNKYVSTATYLNVGTGSTATNALLNVNGGIRFSAHPLSHGLNVVSLQSFNNSSQNSSK